MPIRVTCHSCGKEFSAWEDLVGKSVQCPKCHAQQIIPLPGQSNRRAEPATDDDDEFSLAALEPPPKAAPMRELPTSLPKPVPTNTCPHCHAPMPLEAVLCDHCGYDKKQGKQLAAFKADETPTYTGFERWFREQLSEGETPEGVVLIVKILGGLVALFLIVVLIASLRFWSLLLLVPLLVLVVLFALGKIGGGSANVWTLVLLLQRLASWRELAWPFPRLRSLDLRNSELTDDDLAELEDLKNVEALDLENTQLTDAGLVYLEDQQQLRFLVLRKTSVTDEGVRRLQRVLPKTWIWH